MKSKLFLIPLLFLSIITNAQTSKNDKIVFLDSKWKETTSDDYDYYRIIKDYRLNQDSYEIKEYYNIPFNGKISTKTEKELINDLELYWKQWNHTSERPLFLDSEIPFKINEFLKNRLN